MNSTVAESIGRVASLGGAAEKKEARASPDHPESPAGGKGGKGQSSKRSGATTH